MAKKFNSTCTWCLEGLHACCRAFACSMMHFASQTKKHWDLTESKLNMAASPSYNASWRWKELPSLVPQQERKWQLIDIVPSILCYLLFMVLVWQMWPEKRLENFQKRPRETVRHILEVRKCFAGTLNRLSLLPLILSCEASLWSCRIILKFWSFYTQFYGIFKYCTPPRSRVCLNPLTPISDGDRNSPFNINTISTR